MDALDSLPGQLAFQPHQFQQADLGNGEAVAADGDDQGWNDGQGQGNLDLERRALAGLALQVDRTADLLDVGLDHVHADATTGDVRHLFRGRETGKEEQMGGFAVGHAGRLLGVDEASLERLGLDALGIDAGAVVDDLDVDLAPFMKGAQKQRAGGRLAPRHARIRFFDAVVHRVAHDVRERVLDRLDDRLVEFGLLALHFQAHFLAAGDGQVAHHARKAFQMLPIGCMRVFMTPSCSSVVIRLSRWVVLRKVVSFCVALNCRIWLRARTSSPTRFMSLSSRLTSTRMLVSATATPLDSWSVVTASRISCVCTIPFSTRISPTRSGSPSICC